MPERNGPSTFSIGHGTRPLPELLTILSEAGIRRLVDVRTAPGSRKHPQFGKDSLSAALEAAGIDYVWRKDLGGWRTPRLDSPHRTLRSAAFRGYADYMDTTEFDQAVRWLIDSAREKATAFMCAESLWWRCHRRLIADALTARGCTVIHLIAPGRSDPHRLHPAAGREGARLVYDREGPEQLVIGEEIRARPS